MIKHETLLKRLQNKGIKIENYNDGRTFVARGSRNSLSWHKQDDSAICVHSSSDETNIMTDCNCDIYFRTIKSAAQFLTR